MGVHVELTVGGGGAIVFVSLEGSGSGSRLAGFPARLWLMQGSVEESGKQGGGST